MIRVAAASALLVLAVACGSVATSAGGAGAGGGGGAGSDLELCSLYRDPSNTCLTRDGTLLVHGECCVLNGYVGYCIGFDSDGGYISPVTCNIWL